MPFPPVPRENSVSDINVLKENIHSLFVYLERLRQSSFDEVVTIVSGDPSLQGPQGIQGPVGPQGVQGVQGQQGITGSQGPPGADGTGLTLVPVMTGFIPTPGGLPILYQDGQLISEFIFNDLGSPIMGEITV